MKWFKFNWFSSKEREQLLLEKKELEQKIEDLSSQSDKLKSDLEFEKVKNEYASLASTKPYKNLYYIGDNLTVVSHDGNVITQLGVSKDLYDKIVSASSFDEIIKMLAPVESLKETETNFDLSPYTSILDNHKDFEKVEKGYIFKGVNLVIPSPILSSFIEIIETNKDEEYQALKMFWLKLALNGMEQSRNDLLNFVRKNDVRITRNGNLILYRRVVSKASVKTGLTEFISNSYYEIKKKRKKSPKNYDVYQDSSYFLQHVDSLKQKKGKRLGNLEQLYKNPDLNKENVFTSWHNKNKHTIKVGQIYSIQEDEINTNNGLCAAGGLHAAAVDYNYSGFGDTPVVVLINPSKTITVPKNETGKLRTTEMFVACINNKPHGVHFDDSSLSAFDEEYNNITVMQLEEALKNKSYSVASVEDYISPITIPDIEKIKEMLKQRFVKI